MKYAILVFCFLISVVDVSGQTSSIYGKITDYESGEELLYANIIIEKNGVYTTGGSTDFEGNYTIPLDPGTYEIKISYTGYPDTIINDIKIKANTKLDIQLSLESHSPKPPHPLTALKGISAVSEGDAVTIYSTRKLIHGKVTDKNSGKEIPKAKIFLFKKNGGIIKEVTTNKEGKYHIRVDTGIYYMNVSCFGYSDTEINQIVLTPKSFGKTNIELIRKSKPEDQKEIQLIKKDSTILNSKTINKIDQSKTIENTSSIYGKITDKESGEELIYASIVLNKNGAFSTGGLSDFDGNYSFPLNTGIYELMVSYTGYKDTLVKHIIIEKDKSTNLDIIFSKKISTEVVVKGYQVPLIEGSEIKNKPLTPEQIKNLPNKECNVMGVKTLGLSQVDEQIFNNNRDTRKVYKLNGIRVSGNLIPIPEEKVDSTINIMVSLKDLLGGTSVTKDSKIDNNKK